jgi:hypothetical protein
MGGLNPILVETCDGWTLCFAARLVLSYAEMAGSISTITVIRFTVQGEHNLCPNRIMYGTSIAASFSTVAVRWPPVRR